MSNGIYILPLSIVNVIIVLIFEYPSAARAKNLNVDQTSTAFEED